MATITLTIPNAAATRIVEAISVRYGYQATIDGAPNPQTKADFTKAWLITQLKSAVKEHEQNTAAALAATNAANDVDNNISIT